jgi:hypothetical protein
MTTKVTLADVLARFSRVLAGGKFEGQTATEVASLKADIETMSRDSFLKDAVKLEIASMVEKGELVTKEAHETKVTAAVKEVTDKSEAEKKAADARQARREKALALGLDLEAPVKEGNKMTVGDYVNSFSLDATGDELFDVALSTLEAAVAKVTPAAPAEGEVDPKEVPAGTAAAAANTGKKPAAKPAAKPAKKPLLAVGGGGAAEDEEANAGEQEADKPKVGRHLLRAL